MTSNHSHGHIGRAILATVLTASLIFGLTLGVPPVEAAQPQGDFFVDDDRSQFEPAINAIAKAELVMGCNPPVNDRFCPDRPVTRGELATLAVRAIGVPMVAANGFNDTASSPHVGAISTMKHLGIVRGCNPPHNDRFCPQDVVSRGEAAAILARGFELPGGVGRFADTTDHIFVEEVAAVAAAGWVSGCNPPLNDRFCPERSLSRAELAVILTRALRLETYVVDHPETSTTEAGEARSTSTTVGVPAHVGEGAYPGEPSLGTLYWGASIQSQGPEKHEEPAGHVMVLHREFFPDWSKRTTGLLRQAREDVAAGRLPWVSIKTPSWADMAAGRHDAEIDEMLRALDALSGPVWLTLHHEPEGGGGVNSPDDPAGPTGHVGMNRRVRERMTALGVDNVALVLNLMGYTWAPGSGRNPDDWWDSSVYDLVGVNQYRHEEATLVTDRWLSTRRWAAARGTDLAVGEWGMRGTDAAAGQRVRDWFEHAANSHRDGRGARVVALSAFDSSQHSPDGSWELSGQQLEVFRELFGDSRNASP